MWQDNYVAHSSKIFHCKPCKRRISVDDIDEIYQQYLTEYLQGINGTQFITQSDIILKEKQSLLEQTGVCVLKNSELLDWQIHEFSEEFTKAQFAEHAQPLN